MNAIKMGMTIEEAAETQCESWWTGASCLF